MNSEVHQLIRQTYSEIQKEVAKRDPFQSAMQTPVLLQEIVTNKTKSLDLIIQKRVQEELLGIGPLYLLLEDTEVTEIMVTSFDQIWFEKNGQKFRLDDQFIDSDSYEKSVFRFCQSRNIAFNFEYPFAEHADATHRWTFVYHKVSRNSLQLCIRRKSAACWQLKDLEERTFCSKEETACLTEIMIARKNFLIVGGTGSGKTTLLNCLLRLLPENERVVVLEDTEELQIPNQISCAMNCRMGIKNQFDGISLQDLLRTSLRLRPDRLVVGEVRGPEAKDLLLALSTGHSGSLATMHADDPQQALLRLEMLVQMGAPQWSLNSIRQLIHLSIHGIIVVGQKDGLRKLQSIHYIHSLESHGFTLTQALRTTQPFARIGIDRH